MPKSIHNIILFFVLILTNPSTAQNDPYDCNQLPSSVFQSQRLSSPSGNGIALDFISYGAIAQRLLIPTSSGLVDVLLGFDNGIEYCNGNNNAGHPYFGATIGRVANRITGGQFPWGGGLAHTSINEEPGNDTLHGGFSGFDRKVWNVEFLNKSAVTFTTASIDGDMGFPGDVNVSVTWVLGEDSWTLLYSAFSPSSSDTVVAMTNHAYWNLNGAIDTVLDHSVVMPTATQVLDVNTYLLPTGYFLNVTDHSLETNAALDFTNVKLVGRDINQTKIYSWGQGYDNAYIFNNYVPKQGLINQASVFCKSTGITMQIATDQPSLQFYSGNFLNGSIPGKASQPNSPGYNHWYALAIEAQQYPDAVNHVNFPSILLKGGSVYSQITQYSFSVSTKE
jgi:aldose 1-epimerase